MGPPPVVTGLSPKEGPPGTRVTIRGEFLGASATDLIGLKICGCDCLLSAEWKSKNKIIARSGPCKGRGDIIVTTRSGGEGTSTVQFRGYHETIGPVKESAVWVEEAAPCVPWGRRPLSPAAHAPPDPLGLSTEGDEGKFPEEDLHELFPDGSGNLADENFEPMWHLLEHHANTSFEDLKAGMLHLQRKVDSQKEGELTFLKANTGVVMDQLDRLVLLRDTCEEEQRRRGREPLPSLCAAIEESIALADSLFSEILSRKATAERTRAALSLLARHKFLFQLPQAIDRNIRKKEYDLVVNDYSRVKNLFGNTDVKLFQKILADIDSKIDDLKDKLHAQLGRMPVSVQQQRKYVRLLQSLGARGDSAWAALAARHAHLVALLDAIRDHFRAKEDAEAADRGKKRVAGAGVGDGAAWGGATGAGGGATGAARGAWCEAAAGALADELASLWTLARWYFAGELAGDPHAQRQDEFKQMIISVVEQFSSHMRACLMGPEVAAGAGAGAGTGAGAGAGAGAVRARLTANLRSLREAYESLIKIDLPSQPLSIVEQLIFSYRVHGARAFLQRALRDVRALGARQTWRVRDYTDHGAITDLPHLLEQHMTDCLSSIHKCVLPAGRRESPLLSANSGAAAQPSANTGSAAQPSTNSGAASNDAGAVLQRVTHQILLAYVAVLEELAMANADQLASSSLSVALQQSGGGGAGAGGAGAGGGARLPQRLLLAAADALYSRRVTLPRIAGLFRTYGLPEPAGALAAARAALGALEATIADTYLEHKGDPLVGTIEPSMYMTPQRPAAAADDPRPYVYEIINNLIAVHAEVDSVCGAASSRYVRDISETVCEELARLAAAPAAPAAPAAAAAAAAFRARLDYRALHLATRGHLTRKAENYLMEALASLPPLENEEEIKRMETLVAQFQSRMALQLASLNCNLETV